MPLEIKNITKKFGEKSIFTNFSYTFNDVGIYALIGDSGKGKTTLFRIIAGLERDYTGEVTEGEVAYAFQEYRLFPTMTALENITQILYERPTASETKDAADMLRAFGFADDALALYPQALSGGMKQRVSLCRALLSKKKIILLDEPFKELDDGLREVLRKFIKKAAENALIIISTHSQKMLEGLDAKIIQI